MSNSKIISEFDEDDNITDERLYGFIKFLENENPYKILGCKKEDSNETFTKRYKKLLAKANQLEVVDKNELFKLELAHRILTNKEFKELYDNKMGIDHRTFIQKFTDLYDNQQRPNFTSSVIYPILSILTYGINSTLIRVQASNSIMSSRQVAKEIYRKRGVGGFYRGIVFSIFVIPAEAFRYGYTEFITRITLNYLKITPDPALLNFIHEASRVFFLYPITIAFDYILLSPMEMNVIDTLKQTMLRPQLLYRGFFYYVGLSIVSKMLRDGINKIGHQIYNLYEKNPKNKFLYYLEVAYNNNLTKALLHTLIGSPFNVVRTQYPSQVIDHIANGTILSSVSSPYTIATGLYNRFGYSKFYNGFVLMFLSRLFTKISMYPVNSIHQTELIFE